MSRTRIATLVCLLVLSSPWLSAARSQDDSFDRPPVNYQTAPVHDAIARLIEEIESGEREFTYDERRGYLDSLLEALDIPISSQVLVFSKTSMQVHRITPERPRAVYFNDDVYVGYCQNGTVIEVASTDPRQGAIFYSLKQQPGGRPVFARDQGQCIICHASGRTQHVPGYFVRSTFPNAGGHPNFGSGSYTTDQTSPFSERWGGWYVTGTHGSMKHLGNVVYREGERSKGDEGQNRETLKGLVKTAHYLSPHSDLVALMVLEHQTQMHNALTFANFETRQALFQTETMNRALDREKDFISETTRRRIRKAAERVVRHLLMCDEFPLESPVSGTSDFVREFQARGIRDSKGRSLREFDLKTRMFRYPCSYLIYSPAFDSLPERVHDLVLARLQEILTGEDTSDDFSHLSAETRQAILEILVDTKEGFAEQLQR